MDLSRLFFVAWPFCQPSVFAASQSERRTLVPGVTIRRFAKSVVMVSFNLRYHRNLRGRHRVERGPCEWRGRQAARKCVCAWHAELRNGRSSATMGRPQNRGDRKIRETREEL